MPVEQLTAKELTSKLKDILESWPLYRVFEYSGAEEMYRLPQYISLDCPSCLQTTYWETDFYGGENNIGGSSGKEYKCRNCNCGPVKYYFHWRKTGETYTFIKVGQYPELEEKVPKSLRSAFNESQMKTYQKAIRMRHFNLGLAACAYLRRIVEDRMNTMLDVLHKVAVMHNMPTPLLAEIEEVKKSKRFTDKVDYAGDLLPGSLRPAGQPNPMAILHGSSLVRPYTANLMRSAWTSSTNAEKHLITCSARCVSR